MQFIIEFPAAIFAPICCAANDPEMLMIADATDPVAIGNALASARRASTRRRLRAIWQMRPRLLQTQPPPFISSCIPATIPKG